MTKSKKKGLLVSLLLLAGAQVATAGPEISYDDFNSGSSTLTESAASKRMMSVGAKISTLGLGAEFKYPLSERVSVSASAYGISTSLPKDTNWTPGILNGKLERHGFIVLGHYHPWGDGFYISGGLAKVSLKDSGYARAMDSKKQAVMKRIDDQFAGTLKTATSKGIDTSKIKADIQRIKANIIPTNPSLELDVDSFSPYLGVGYDGGYLKPSGLAFDVSAGMMIPTGKLKQSGFACNKPTLNESVLASRADQIVKQCKDQVKSFEDEVDTFKSWAKLSSSLFLSAGATYRF